MPKCPHCGCEEIEKFEYVDKEENKINAVVGGTLTATGSGLAAAGVCTLAKVSIGAKLLGTITVLTGPIGPAIAIPTAVVLGGGIAVLKAFLKTKKYHKCKKCGQLFT